jgi:lipopolysaccharide export system permease protein
MVVNVIILVPLSKQLNKNFLEYKKAEAKFNIQDSKFGQKFSNWLVYIDKSEKNQTFKNVTLYKKGINGNAPRLILSQKALIQNADGILRLVLENGKAFEFQKDKIEQIDFKKMYINSKHSESIGYMQTISDYWKFAFKNRGRAYDFAFFILISLFPISTVFLAIGIATVTSRYGSNGIYLYIFISTALYFSFVFLTAKVHPFASILVVPIVSILLSYIIYKKRVSSRF